MYEYPVWTTRAESEADIPAVREINLAAFETPLEADLVTALRADPHWVDGLSMLSLDPDGMPVGHALMTRCHIDEAPALCLAPCAVRPVAQRTGAGSAAIRALLRAEDIGECWVVVLGPTDGRLARSAREGPRVRSGCAVEDAAFPMKRTWLW